jgi:hypothetical protein
MILQAGAYSVCQLLDHLEQSAARPDMRDFAAFVSLSSWTSPRGFASVWANIPGDAQSFARVQLS